MPEDDDQDITDPPGSVPIGSAVLRRPEWWFDHDGELREATALAEWEEFAAFGRTPVGTPIERPVQRLTLSVEEAAEALGLSRAFAYEAVNRGEIPSIRIGRRILVPRVALDRLLESTGQGE